MPALHCTALHCTARCAVCGRAPKSALQRLKHLSYRESFTAMGEDHDVARVGLWVTLVVIKRLLFVLMGGLVIRHLNKKAAAPRALAMAAVTAAAMPSLEDLKDVALSGVVAGPLYFGTAHAP